MRGKFEYVRDRMRTPARGHTCHWPGCVRKVPPALWGCKEHWYLLPRELRDRIWRTFKPGQEQTKTPSREYIEAAKDVDAWIRENHPTPQERML
jgi:hypothetical protein